MNYDGLTKRELREKLVRSDNAIAVQLAEKKHYQARYYELLNRHNQLYIQTLNRGWRNERNSL